MISSLSEVNAYYQATISVSALTRALALVFIFFNKRCYNL